MTRTVTVLGAGIVGLCTARCLQHSGLDVVLVDRGEPAMATSFGNLGMLCSVEHALPLASMEVLKSTPAMLMDPASPLVIRWRYLPRLMPWLTRFVVNSFEHRRMRNAKAMATLMQDTLGAYTRLVSHTPTGSPFIRRLGSIDVYRKKATFEAGAGERARLRSLGVRVDELNAEEIGQLEPAVSRDFAHGVYFPDCGHCLDPHGLGRAVFDTFMTAGGHFVKREVIGFEIGADGVRKLLTTDESISTEALVLATGAWSGNLARQLGSPVPLDTERGYHTMLHGVDGGIHRPVGDGENHVGATQMNGGLRIGGTVELAGLEAEPDYERARIFYEQARQMLPALPPTEEMEITRWMGFRPTLPDYLPVLGASPEHRNVWFAFGHQHLGLSLAARTGELVTTLVRGEKPDIELHPFRPDRF